LSKKPPAKMITNKMSAEKAPGIATLRAISSFLSAEKKFEIHK
jgi:hypothetical protein